MEERKEKGLILHRKGYEFCKKLISKGKIDYESDWSFEADEENRLIEEKGFETFTLCHLAYEEDGNPEAKGTWKFPVAKLKGDDVVVFRRGVIAAKQRASQFGYDEIFDAADRLLQLIDEQLEEEEERAKDLSMTDKVIGHYKRTFSFVSATEDTEYFEVSVSSEEPVFRGYYWEILEHNEESIDDAYLRYGIPVLFQHNPDEILGIVEEWYIKDGKLRVKFRFSNTATKYIELFKEGILRHVSIGYEIIKAEKRGEREGFPVIVAIKWRPLEFSFVSIPADVSVGVGRAMEIEKTEKKEEVKMEEVKKEEVKNINVKEFELTEKEHREYSLHRALRSILEKGTLEGLEKEISDEVARKYGKSTSEFSFWVPVDILKRANLSAPGIIETKISEEFELGLRSALVVAKAGAQVIEGLVGQVQFPREGTKPILNWIDPSSPSPTESSTTITAVTASPKTATIDQPVPKSLIKQTSRDVETYLRKMFLAELAVGIEGAAFVGTGTNGQPLGLANTSGVNAINHSNNVITRAAILNALSYIEGNEVSSVAWVMNGKLYTVLRQIPLASGYPLFLIENRTCEGYPVFTTNVIPNTGTNPEVSQIFLGDFSKMIIGVWDAFEIIVDPYTLANKGAIKVVLNAFVDVVVTKPEVFVRIYNVKTSAS